MLLAHRLWEEVERRRDATLEDWARAHEAALDELKPEFDAQWRRLRHVRAEDDARGHRRRGLALPCSRARAAGADEDDGAEGLQRLGARAELEPEGRKQVVVDPLFAEWIEGLGT